MRYALFARVRWVVGAFWVHLLGQIPSNDGVEFRVGNGGNGCERRVLISKVEMKSYIYWPWRVYPYELLLYELPDGWMIGQIHPFYSLHFFFFLTKEHFYLAVKVKGFYVIMIGKCRSEMLQDGNRSFSFI